jgi:hypothetical protein
VTVTPVILFKNTADTTVALKAGQDSASSLASIALSATLQGASIGAGTAPPGVGGGIIFYSVQSFIPQKPGSPAVFLTDGSGNLTNVDTGDVSGAVSRTLVINTQQVADTLLLQGKTTDSVVVTAHITYKGTVIPTVFTIRIKGPFAS